jgi:hypothetical protein
MSLVPSFRFLATTVRHKWFVYQAGRRLGVSRWQLLVHDLSGNTIEIASACGETGSAPRMDDGAFTERPEARGRPRSPGEAALPSASV